MLTLLISFYCYYIFYKNLNTFRNFLEDIIVKFITCFIERGLGYECTKTNGFRELSSLDDCVKILLTQPRFLNCYSCDREPDVILSCLFNHTMARDIFLYIFF